MVVLGRFAEAGISRESLYRTLSAKGNPTHIEIFIIRDNIWFTVGLQPDMSG